MGMILCFMEGPAGGGGVDGTVGVMGLCWGWGRKGVCLSSRSLNTPIPPPFLPPPFTRKIFLSFPLPILLPCPSSRPLFYLPSSPSLPPLPSPPSYLVRPLIWTRSLKIRGRLFPIPYCLIYSYIIIMYDKK